MSRYILSVDQSTQGTKALLFSEEGKILERYDLPHHQYINDQGWVEHDPEEIYRNTVEAVRRLVEKSGIHRAEIAALGISNQRETAVCWERKTGKPVYNAIVWQCARAKSICEEIAGAGLEDMVREKTGLRLSPYFSAGKLAWIMRQVPGVAERAKAGEICVGTMDSYLVYRLTGGKRHQTDYSNASRTQLFNIHTLAWDEELLQIFGIDPACMPLVTDSNGDYGCTDFEGFLEKPIPIRAALGDSHAALFGQGCLRPGMMKATYGTGSSIMMNIGAKPIESRHGLVTSLAWSMNGKTEYVLEGNINYTGAVITWLKEDLRLIASPVETEDCARAANPGDKCYLVPAFSGLGAPYWDSGASAAIVGMTRTTGKNELCRAALDCIAYQVSDIVDAMAVDSGIELKALRADGGPTRNRYLMQFQSDMLNIPVAVPDAEELSAIGAAYAAGLAVGLYHQNVFDVLHYRSYTPSLSTEIREQKQKGWHNAVERVR